MDGMTEYYYPKFDDLAGNESIQNAAMGYVRLPKTWVPKLAKYRVQYVGGSGPPTAAYDCDLGAATPIMGDPNKQDFLLSAKPPENDPNVLGKFPTNQQLLVWYDVKIEDKDGNILNITVGSTLVKAKKNDRPK